MILKAQMADNEKTPQEKIVEIVEKVECVQRCCDEINEQLEALRADLAAREEAVRFANQNEDGECSGMLPE
jgi:hypothetical protein